MRVDGLPVRANVEIEGDAGLATLRLQPSLSLVPPRLVPANIAKQPLVPGTQLVALPALRFRVPEEAVRPTRHVDLQRYARVPCVKLADGLHDVVLANEAMRSLRAGDEVGLKPQEGRTVGRRGRAAAEKVVDSRGSHGTDSSSARPSYHDR